MENKASHISRIMISKWLLNSVLWFSRVLLAATFIFSGFVKAVDPQGTAIKFTEYFTAFGIESLGQVSNFLAIVLATFEFWIGTALFIGYRTRLAAVLVLLTMLLMTPLTLYVALFNPVSDCGCFGDAIVLTNWQTFYKNLLLLPCAWIVFRNRARLFQLFKSDFTQTIASFYSMFYAVILAITAYTYLPLIDFRPFKVGTDIVESMKIPEGASTEQFETTLIYEKDGKRKEFTLENYPEGDSTWHFVEAINKQLQQDYEPPIKSFSIWLRDGENITQDILSDTSYTFLMVAPFLENASDENVDEINELYDYSVKYGYKYYCLTASTETDIEDWAANTGAEYSFAICDKATLQTISRANPGFMLLKHGVIINKWSHSFLPTGETLSVSLDKSSLSVVEKRNVLRQNTMFTLAYLLPLSLAIFLKEALARTVRLLVALFKSLISRPKCKKKTALEDDESNEN